MCQLLHTKFGDDPSNLAADACRVGQSTLKRGIHNDLFQGQFTLEREVIGRKRPVL